MEPSYREEKTEGCEESRFRESVYLYPNVACSARGHPRLAWLWPPQKKKLSHPCLQGARDVCLSTF